MTTSVGHSYSDSFDESSVLSTSRTGSRGALGSAGEVAVAFGSALRRGQRDAMEDYAIIMAPEVCDEFAETRGGAKLVDVPEGLSRAEERIKSFAAVFDGHGGAATARRLAKRLHRTLCEVIQEVDDDSSWALDVNRRACIREAYERFEKEWLAKLSGDSDTMPDHTSGSTAIAVLVTSDNLMYIANVGDSRALLVRNNRVVMLSRDQTPALASEHRRVTDKGGRIRNNLVDGVLSMTRAFGDFELKQRERLFDGAVTAQPDIKRIELTNADHFVLLASDGVFDVLSSKAAASIVRRSLRAQSDSDRCRLDVACAELVETAIASGSSDNASCVLMLFDHTA